MITVEQLEKLATELEANDQAQRARLQRLCKAYVRILRIRQPGQFAAHPGDCDVDCSIE